MQGITLLWYARFTIVMLTALENNACSTQEKVKYLLVNFVLSIGFQLSGKEQSNEFPKGTTQDADWSKGDEKAGLNRPSQQIS